MALFIENLDDALAQAGSFDFRGGQVSGVAGYLLQDNQAKEMVNMTISPTGVAQTRIGIESLSTSLGTALPNGMAYYDTPTQEQTLIATGGTLYALNAAGSTVGTASTTSSDHEFSQFNDRMYMVDGASRLRFWDGTTISTQGAGVFSVTVTSGGSNYTTATVTIGAPELSGGTTATGTAIITGSAITAVTITGSGSGYLTAPTVTITGNGTGATAVATVNSAGTGYRLVANQGKRLFAVGSGANRNTLYASDILDASSWLSSNSVVVGGADGQEITAIAPYYDNGILVFKPGKIYLVTADPAATSAASWQIQILSDTIGCVARRSVAQVNSDVVFYAADGLRSVQRSLSDDFSVVALPFSEPVKDVIQLVNRSQYSKINAVFHNGRYYIALPLGADTNVTKTLVFNSIFNAFEGLWTMRPARMVETNFAADGVRLALVTTDSRAGVHMDHKDDDEDEETQDYRDFGTAYASSITTKDWNLGDPFGRKHGSHFEIEFSDCGSDEVDIYLKRDSDNAPVLVLADYDAAGSRLTLPITLPTSLPAAVVKRKAMDLRAYEKWREINFKVEADEKKMLVRSVMLAANPDTIELET